MLRKEINTVIIGLFSKMLLKRRLKVIIQEINMIHFQENGKSVIIGDNL